MKGLSMDNQTFLDLREELEAHCLSLLDHKRIEYSGDSQAADRLSQFKKAATLLSCHPSYALCGMMLKHITSICDMTDDMSLDVIYDRDKWLEKIGDARNYLDLLWAIVNEVEND
jgi:hypothetical protein